MSKSNVAYCFSYIQEEVQYGCNLYITGWTRLVFHPLQTVKDTAFAITHPLQTGKALLGEFWQHPLGFSVNFGLSWLTGKFIKSTVRYVDVDGYIDTYFESSGVKSTYEVPAQVPSSNTLFSSAAVQLTQLSAWVMTGSCCGGVCTATAAGRLGQTSSLIAGQSATATAAMRNQREPSRGIWENCKSSFFSSYFEKKSVRDNLCHSDELKLK